MKKNLFYILIALLLSCKSEKYVDEKCIGNKEITQIGNLKTGDILSDFTAYPSKGTRFSVKNANKDKGYIFFKRKQNPQGLCINDEILNPDISHIVQKR